jgi:heme-degrading monooxygenase HmoA
MILELATIDIKEGQIEAFEAQLEKAQDVISQAGGYLGHEFQRCIEQPNRYILLIRWNTLEDHTIGFRESDLFKEWRSLIGSYFAGAPTVEHYELKFKR